MMAKRRVNKQVFYKPYRIPAFLILLLLAAITATLTQADDGKPQGEPQPTLPTVVLNIDNHQLTTELAISPVERQRGLSFRQTLGDDNAMLFVYNNERRRLFTMRETSIPLSIAFINSDLEITQILDMLPYAIQNYPSRHPARYALEVNKDWFDKHGIKAGAKIAIDPSSESTFKFQ